MSEMQIVSDASDADAEKMLEIKTHFLNGSCRWIWNPWGVDLEPGMGGCRIQGKIVLRKSGNGFGARDGRGLDPGENSVKKISTHFLNGICSWIWTPGEWIWSP